MKCAGGDKQDVVGFHAAVFSAHGRAFDKRQEVALNAFARYAGAALVVAIGNLIYFVNEYDTGLLGEFDSIGSNLFLVDQLRRLFLF